MALSRIEKLEMLVKNSLNPIFPAAVITICLLPYLEEDEVIILNRIVGSVSPIALMGQYQPIYCMAESYCTYMTKDPSSNQRLFELIFASKDFIKARQPFVSPPPSPEVYYLTSAHTPALFMGMRLTNYRWDIKSEFKKHLPLLANYLGDNYSHADGETITLKKNIPRNVLIEASRSAEEKHLIYSITFFIVLAASALTKLTSTRPNDTRYNLQLLLYNAYIRQLLMTFANAIDIDEAVVHTHLQTELNAEELNEKFCRIQEDCIDQFLTTTTIFPEKKLAMAKIGSPMSACIDFKNRLWKPAPAVTPREKVNNALNVERDPDYIPRPGG